MKRIQILMALCAGVAEGAVLAPATVTGSVFFNLTPPPRIDFSGFGIHRQTGPGGMVQFGSIAMPMPAVMAEAEVERLYFGRSSGILSYEMQILGPGGEVPVDAMVSGAIAGSTGVGEQGTSFALTAAMSLRDMTEGRTLIKADGAAVVLKEGSHRDAFSFTRQLMMTAGHVYRIELLADVGVAAGTGLEASGMAWIYPTFRLGAGAGSGYSFAFSSGIGNGDEVATPEPGAMGLMGLGAIAIWGWKRRG